MLRNHKNRIPVYIIAVIAAVITYFLSSQYNLGFSPDSVTYLETANNLISGKGFTALNGKFVNHWPPGYPIFVYLTSKLLGISTILAGTIGNAIIIFFTILALFEIFNLYQIPVKIAYILLFLYILSPISSTYLWFLSEGLFILLILLSFLFFTKWVSRRSVSYLALCAFILGISVLVRYAGIGLFLGYMAYLLLRANYKLVKTGMSNFLVFNISFLVPLLPWLFYTRLHGVASHDRRFDFEFISQAKFLEMFLSFGSWIFGNFIGLLFLGSTISILAIIYRRNLKFALNVNFIPLGKKTKLPIVLGVVYFFFILFSASFLDHAIPLSNRIFSPVYPFFLFCLGFFLTFIYQKISVKLSYIFPLLILISYSFRSLPIFINHYNEGSGFTSQKFNNSQLINFVQEDLQKKQLYTNDTFLLKIFTGNQKIIQLPVIGNSAQLEEIKPLIMDGKAAIVYFEEINWRNYVVSKKTLLKTFENGRTIKFKDGFILVNN